MISDKATLIMALIKAHDAFIQSMANSGYYIFWDDNRKGKIYKKPVLAEDRSVGKIKIKWRVKE